jgi:PAS domain S-box-containing protein/putative nucleotidyltransferase with HDIG domain
MKDEDKTKEQLILDLAALRDRCTEESLEHYYDTGTAINALLRLSLEDYSLEELLQRALDIILSVSSLSIETKGSIFLVEDEPEVLIQKVQRGLAEPLLKECARVPFGKCLCGRAASTKRIEFADHIDERHEVSYEGVAPHGHYCVPVLLSGNTIGVINLYLKDGHSRVGREEEFLDSVANTLAGIIKRKQAEEALKESEEKYRSIVENAQEGIYRTTPEGRFITVNRAMADMLGYESPEELIASYTDITHQLYVNPEDRTKLRRMVEEHGYVKGFETQFYRKDGNRIWVAIHIRAVHDTNGRVLYYEGLNEDITMRKQADEERKQSLERLRKALGATIQVMVSAVEMRDPYTAGHQIRSADLARAIAMEMGLPREKIDGIRMAGSIHDIGKLSIPAEILSKPTKLSEIEFSLIKEHARKGFEMLKDVEFPWPLAEIAYQHHERMDGSGYPRNLKGDEILMEARIMAVADVVESMASHRPYRPGLGIDAALEEIEKNKGIFYDNTVADACLRLFREKGFQLKVT